jgi:hypothetical protein
LAQGASHGAILIRIGLSVSLQLLSYFFEVHLVVDLVELGRKEILAPVDFGAFDGDHGEEVEGFDFDLGFEVVHHGKDRLQHLLEGVVEVSFLVKFE